MTLTPKQYDRLKFIAQILLPALGTLYAALAGIWGLPAADNVVGTVLAVDTFLGVILQLSSNKYNMPEGVLHLFPGEDENHQGVGISLPTDPEALARAEKIVLRVKKP